MSFFAPIWLAAAAAVGVGVIIAHLFSTSVPPRDYLPTVRFVPEGAPLAVMRTRRLTDATLLLLRLLAVALVGLALAGAHRERVGPPRVVIVDASRAVGSMPEVRDSARAAGGDGAVYVAFDSLARRLPADSIAVLAGSQARGSISAALVAAHRVLSNVTDGRARTELVIVSPAVREETDSATAGLLALWSGPVRHVRVSAAMPPATPRVAVRAVGDDPVAAAVVQIPRLARDDNGSGVRIVRTVPTRADSLWARDSGGALVIWPADARSGALASRAAADTTTGVAAGRHVVVAAFARASQPRAGRVIARWIDGEPAATEAAFGTGCVRDVAVPVDPVGDVVLRESFRGVIGVLTERCDGARNFDSTVVLSDAKDLLVREQQILRSAQDDKVSARGDMRLAIWLAAFALAALIAEQVLRSRARIAS